MVLTNMMIGQISKGYDARYMQSHYMGSNIGPNLWWRGNQQTMTTCRAPAARPTQGLAKVLTIC